MIEKNQIAPNFQLKDQGNNLVTLSSFRGHKVFLFFFPEINTLNDQVHVISYAREIAWFQRLGIIVIGISGSSVEELYEQTERLFFPFLLLSDQDAVVRKLYDVWHYKAVFGTKRWITARTGLIIDENGVVLRTWKRINLESHAYEVLDYLQHRHDKEAWRKLSRRTKERIRREEALRKLTEKPKEKEVRRYIITKR